jgi:hypothetical protein
MASTLGQQWETNFFKMPGAGVVLKAYDYYDAEAKEFIGYSHEIRDKFTTPVWRLASKEEAMVKTMGILLEKSLMNCHCRGLDSIVIKDKPGMVRMFIARPDHQLHMNQRNGHQWSVAMHRHHCDITIHPIVGEIYQLQFGTGVDAELVGLRTYDYESPIGSGKPGHFRTIDSSRIPMAVTAQRLTGPTTLSAEFMHTIYVPYGQVAAWYIWEGTEKPNYSPIVYSPRDLSDFDFSELDQPMTLERLTQDLRWIGVGR